MFKSFEKLSDEKKRKIINVCVGEFSRFGYQKTSTNTIVENAEISKGILFHYFGNKKKLFLYVLDYVLDDYYGRIKEYIGDNIPKDIFERVRFYSLAKFEVSSYVPKDYNEFITKAFAAIPKGLEHEMQERYVRYYGETKRLYFQDIDFSNFREDIGIEKAIEMIFFVLEGINQKYLKLYKGKEPEMIKDFEEITKEFDEYLEILRKSFYKK